jgi:hypothetical protein
VPDNVTEALDQHQEDARQFLEAVRGHQEALWAVFEHCNIVVGPVLQGDDGTSRRGIRIYVPSTINGMDVEQWLKYEARQYHEVLHEAAVDIWPDVWPNIELRSILAVPDQLADFVAKNTGRPMPGRFVSTSVRYEERDGIIWLTPPEVVLYDYLKAAGWTFIPQPAFVLGDETTRRPDFLIYWGGRANQAVLVEVDSDRYHGLPSQREGDENKERYFQSFGFEYLRFNAKSCMQEPKDVIAEIKKFCVNKFGPAR